MLYHAMLSRHILRLMRKLIRRDLIWLGFTSVSPGKHPFGFVEHNQMQVENWGIPNNRRLAWTDETCIIIDMHQVLVLVV